MDCHWGNGRAGYRCRHGHTGPRADDRPAIPGRPPVRPDRPRAAPARQFAGLARG
ncbi:hypothetical protein [Saccharothrix deserti]|uniref:hypothetical protein n=1 Tax=Saccharothrix deserti TaxID=2593674 RepID=UPI003B75BB02